MTTNKKLNTFFNNIGNNAIKNEETSIGIVEELTIQNLANNLKSNGSTIYTLLGVKNASGITSEMRGLDSVSKLTEKRKILVNKLIFPQSDLKHLIEEEKSETPKAKTKVEKKEVKQDKAKIVELDYASSKSELTIKNNAIRTTANNVVFPFVFLASQDVANYSFEKNKVKINTRNLSKEVCKSVFGFNKDNADVGFMYCNFSMLVKLAKAHLTKVELQVDRKASEEIEELESAVKEISTGKFDDTKAKNIVSSICIMLDKLDNEKAFSEILQIENHILQLDQYGMAKYELTNNVRKQSGNSKNYDLIGSVAVEFDHSKTFEAKSFEDLETQFNKTFAIK
jgi:hypothetical protein